MIVGNPRSGTTLVQRIASELTGVHVPPETHFFDTYVAGLIQRRRFPLDRTALAEELRTYLTIDTVADLPIDPDTVIEILGGRCESPVELFSAIVEALSPGVTVRGEKTPDHLRWWRPLTEALPHLRMVAVMRDPRAVVSSGRKMPWSSHPHGILAEAWRCGAEAVMAMRTALPDDRCLVLRYEDVVASPDEARGRIARLLGLPQDAWAPLADEEAQKLFLPREWFKEKVRGPVSSQWVDQWRSELSAQEAADVAQICSAEMREFGYDAPAENGPLRPELTEQAEFWRFWLDKKLAEVEDYERAFSQ